MIKTIQIKPLDPLLLRDGRPFGATPGASAFSVDTISPSVVAGTIRTMVGKHISSVSDTPEVFQSDKKAEAVKKAKIRGPIHLLNGQVFFSFPQDVDVYELEHNTLKVSFRRPCAGISSSLGFLGTDKDGRYEDELWPVAQASTHKTWREKPSYVSADWMNRWLMDKLTPEDWEAELTRWRDEENHANPRPTEQVTFLAAFPRDARVHTAIDEETKSARDKHLFSTEMLVLPDNMSLLTEIDMPESANSWPEKPLSTLHSFGGKRRLAHFSQSESSAFDYPEFIQSSLRTTGKAEFVRMVLATPAYFAKGWLPGWVDTDTLVAVLNNEDVPVVLKLRWACIPRWQPVSGWSYQKKQEKAVRRMVPAGSVYFFQVESGDPAQIMEQLWLRSISDPNRRKGAFDKEDGFGLAMWGIWTPDTSSEKRGNGNEY